MDKMVLGLAGEVGIWKIQVVDFLLANLIGGKKSNKCKKLSFNSILTQTLRLAQKELQWSFGIKNLLNLCVDIYTKGRRFAWSSSN